MNSGSWTDYRFLTRCDYKVFCEAIEGLCGIALEPVLVSSQVVSGTNYQFICNATTTCENPRCNYIAEVSVSKQPNCSNCSNCSRCCNNKEEATITNICEMSCNSCC